MLCRVRRCSHVALNDERTEGETVGLEYDPATCCPEASHISCVSLQEKQNWTASIHMEIHIGVGFVYLCYLFSCCLLYIILYCLGYFSFFVSSTLQLIYVYIVLFILKKI